MFRVTGLKILSRVGTHINFFSGNNIILCIFKMHQVIFFSEILKFLGLVGSGYPKQTYFIFDLGMQIVKDLE